MSSTIPWYSLDRDLKTENHDPVDLPGALAVVDRYFAQLRPHYASGEEALAATMFGFRRAPDDLLELCLHTPSQISLRVELPRSTGGGFLARLRGRFRFEEQLPGRSSVAQRVEQYFTLTPEQIQAQLTR